MKNKKRLLALAFALMMAVAAPLQAHASAWCDTADRYNGACNVCNGLCALELWMESTDASDGWF